MQIAAQQEAAAMFIVAIIIQSIVLVALSALAAGLLCWLVSTAANLLHHPAWGALLLLILPSILFLAGLTRSEFVKLSALCSLFGALFLWVSGAPSPLPADFLKRSDP